MACFFVQSFENGREERDGPGAHIVQEGGSSHCRQIVIVSKFVPLAQTELIHIQFKLLMRQIIIWKSWFEEPGVFS